MVFKTLSIRQRLIVTKRQETNEMSPLIAPVCCLKNFQTVAQEKEPRWSLVVPLSSKDRTESQGRTRRLEFAGQILKESCTEWELWSSAKGGPWVFSWAELSIEDAIQGQGKNHQRIRSNNIQDSCRAWNSSCSYHSFENNIIHGVTGSVLKRVLSQ